MLSLEVEIQVILEQRHHSSLKLGSKLKYLNILLAKKWSQKNFYFLKQAKIGIWKFSPQNHISFYYNIFLTKNIVSPILKQISVAWTLSEHFSSYFFSDPLLFSKFETEGCLPLQHIRKRGTDTVNMSQMCWDKTVIIWHIDTFFPLWYILGRYADGIFK